MRTRGNHGAGHRSGPRAGHRVGTVAIAGLALVALGVGSPAQAADHPTPGSGTTAGQKPAPTSGSSQTKSQTRTKPQPKPKPDLTPPARPALGEASTGAGGTVRLEVQAESGSALVVREGADVVASASAVGSTQTLSWESKSGPRTFLVSATDAAGNVSDPAPLTLEVDATPPAARKFVVTPGTERDSRTQWDLATDPGTAYRLLVDGETVAEGTTKGRVVRGLLELADGKHDVEVELRDEVGNLRTATDTVTVDIPALWVVAKDVSEPNSPERSFRVAAPPGTRGFLRVPGAGNTRFLLPEGRAAVTLEVPEGSHEAPVVVVADNLDRKGTTELEAFEVDLTAPVVTVETATAAAERGVLSATITAGEGDTVGWRLLTAAGTAVMSGEFVADGSAQLLEREVAEGSYELEVTATDANGNVTVELLDTPIAAGPLVNPDVVPALTITLALWVAVGLVVFLRRRGRRLRKLAANGVRGLRSKRARLAAEHGQAVAAYEEQLADFEREDRVWQQRRAELAQLVAVARGGSVEHPATGIRIRPEERVLCVLPASLVELRNRDGAEVPVEVEDGQLVVTESRVAFSGTRNREWELAKLEQIRHLGQDRTLMKVSNRKTTSGVAYADADLVRLYLELAMAEANGDSRSVRMMLEQGARSHELRRPQPPTPPSTAADPSVAAPSSVAAVPSSGATQRPAVIEQQGGPADERIGRELMLQG